MRKEEKASPGWRVDERKQLVPMVPRVKHTGLWVCVAFDSALTRFGKGGHRSCQILHQCAHQLYSALPDLHWHFNYCWVN